MNLETTNRYRCLMFVGASMVLVAVGIFIGVFFGSGKAIQSAEQSAAVQSAPGYSYIPPSSIRRNGTTGHSTNVGISEDGQATPSPISPSSTKGGSSFGGKEGETGRVTRVIDGDTIEIEINGRTETVDPVRGKSPKATAETLFRTSNGVNPRKPVQCFDGAGFGSMIET